jgi:hypothetical protein
MYCVAGMKKPASMRVRTWLAYGASASIHGRCMAAASHFTITSAAR